MSCIAVKDLIVIFSRVGLRVLIPSSNTPGDPDSDHRRLGGERYQETGFNPVQRAQQGSRRASAAHHGPIYGGEATA
jgi:hypothetical protein